MTVIGILPGGSQVAPLVLARSPPCGGVAGSSWKSHIPTYRKQLGGCASCFQAVVGAYCIPVSWLLLQLEQVDNDGWSWNQLGLTPPCPAVALLSSGSAQRKRRPSPFSWQPAMQPTTKHNCCSQKPLQVVSQLAKSHKTIQNHLLQYQCISKYSVNQQVLLAYPHAEISSPNPIRPIHLQHSSVASILYFFLDIFGFISVFILQIFLTF